MRKLSITGVMAFLAISALAQTSGPDWIPFTWESATMGDRKIEKTAMSVPVKIGKMPYRFEAQFDLGASATILYGNTFAPYLEKYGDLKQSESTRTVTIQGESCPILSKTDLILGETAFLEKDIALLPNSGEVMTTDSVGTNSVKHIGTVAADLFNTGVLVIDYPAQRLCRLENIPRNWEAKFEFVDIDYDAQMNWILIPLKIGDQTHKVLFDTGSSMFALLSSKSHVSTIADTKHYADSLSVGAWGNTVQVYGYKSDVPVQFGSVAFAPHPVYASPYLDDQTLSEAGFWGVVGNRYFLDRTILIDYKHKRFGISRK